jgi:hypothetical protein
MRTIPTLALLAVLLTAPATLAVEGNLSAALQALSDVTRQCVACHAGYRLE